MFEDLVEEIGPFTLLCGDPKLKIIYDFASYALALDGDFAEVGVYRGGVSMMLKLLVDRTHARRGKSQVHAFDTFTGIPNAGPNDGIPNGTFADHIGDTVHRLERMGIRVHRGVFPATAKEVRDRRFSLAHFDADTERSCLDFLHFFVPRMVPGGVLIFDDYGWKACPAVRRVVDSFFSTHIGVPMNLTPNQAVVLIPPT